VLISVDSAGKNQLEPGQESVGVAPALSHCSLLRKFEQNRPVCWSIVVEEKPTVGSQFCGSFASARIQKATKDVSQCTFLYSQFYLSINYISEFLQLLEATANFLWVYAWVVLERFDRKEAANEVPSIPYCD
jgi:hypothetical protein